jgi:DNA-binding NarL/FixJ family response regulator
MPKLGGIAAIKEVKSQYPETKILALTVHKSDEYILAVFEAGAEGYCLKDADQDELMKAIEHILSGKTYLSPEVSEKVLEGYLEGRKTLKKRSTWQTLTQREKEVLKLIGEGYKSKEISNYLCISWKTVEKHRANIMQKLDLHSASALTAYAIEKGLVSK